MQGFSGRIAIVGFGPRGLGALEALIKATQHERAELRIDIFDPADFPGAGPNFSPAEDPLCLLNLPVRDIELPDPVSSATLPAFRDWLTGADDQADRFPPRAVLGAYLSERFARLLEAIEPEVIVTHHRKLVSGLEKDADGWRLRAGEFLAGPYDEVLLSLGQPRAKPDKQLAAWRTHADQSGATLIPAYPGRDLVAAARAWHGKTVAIRGLGLSTLDVVRLLTLGLGGKFERGGYVPSGREPARIVPFSLDGVPPSPKPASGALDAVYDLTPGEQTQFAETLNHALTMPPTDAVGAIAEALVAPALRILAGSADAAAINDWLTAEQSAAGSQETLGGIDALRRDIGIAQGRTAPTIGYAIGQIWRKCQGALRVAFDGTRVAAETAAAIVRFDEGLKRYSYGPPVEAADQLRMLVEAGVVTLRAADDPDVVTTDRGWQLHEGEAQIDVDVMIDAVIASPRLDQTEDPALRSLLSTERIDALHASLGARVLPDGTLPGAEGLSLTGRMALGSVIGTDSIHDCFGEPVERWAKGVVERATRRADVDAYRPALRTAI